MAKKSKVRGLNEALDELFANYEESLTEAMKYAAEQAKKDIRAAEESCIEDYYNYDPTSYDRTMSLFDAFAIGVFIPYMKVGKTKKGNMRADAGVAMWPMLFDGLYTDGSNKWRPVEGWWILDNYLKGIHPATDGSSEIGAPYTPHYDGEGKSPDEKMKKYLEGYGETFNNSLIESFAKQITRR